MSLFEHRYFYREDVYKRQALRWYSGSYGPPPRHRVRNGSLLQFQHPLYQNVCQCYWLEGQNGLSLSLIHILIQLRGIRIRILVEHIRGVVGGDQCFDFLQIGRTVRDIDMIPGNIRIHLSLILFKDVIQALVRGKIFRPYGVNRPVLFRLVGAAIVFAAGALRLRKMCIRDRPETGQSRCRSRI